VFRVLADRFEYQVEFVGAVDLARDALGHVGPHELGFGEVIEPGCPPRTPCAVRVHQIENITG
jgi:hypothetical protein